MNPIVSIIMGSTSDLPVMEKAAQFLDSMEIPFEMNALSAHRTPAEVEAFAAGAKTRGLKVIIAGAGMAAALPGVIAAGTTVPVIGVPIKGMLDGLDAMLSIIQMPPGIPVATVGVNGALNAAILAAEMLALSDQALAARLENLQNLAQGKNRKGQRRPGRGEHLPFQNQLTRPLSFFIQMDILNYAPRASCRVQIGHVTLGADEPLRLQSMTTTPTDDVEASTAQAERLFAAGADIVRLTAQGMRQVEALKQIRQRLNADGFTGPLVADIHFNPDVADAAAAVVEKVRINPGNYVDPARTFQHKVYTDAEYRAELQRLEARFTRLLDVCRQHHTALRIGVNHGSLSDRIMSRYGDTPEGIVESCMEFLRVCRKTGFSNVVVSVKASQTAVMVRSVRLLCAAMEKEGMRFPLHLGVTEAGEGEDGRIRSAVGIGALLADGIGDTLRVSLSEAPEAEVPVAYKLAAHVVRRAGHPFIYGRVSPDFSYTHPQRRPTRAVLNIGGGQAPVVIGERTDGAANEVGALPPDYLYTSRHLPDTPQANCAYIVDADVWQPRPRTYPAFAPEHLMLPGHVAQ